MRIRPSRHGFGQIPEESAGARRLLTNQTMVVFKKVRRALLAKQLSDAANLALGALAFGQFIGTRQLSVVSFLCGAALWLALVCSALAVAGEDAQ
jgi:hypothetical protein